MTKEDNKEIENTVSELLEKEPQTSYLTKSKPLKLIAFFFLALVLILVGVVLGLKIADKFEKEVVEDNLSIPTGVPSTDDTANWKTYTNEKDGIQFQYPEKFRRMDAPKEYFGLIDTTNKKPRVTSMADIVFRKIENPKKTSVEKLIMENTFFDGSGLNPKSFSEYKKEKIENNYFYTIDTGLFEGLLSSQYYFIRNSDVFLFDMYSSPVDWTNPDYNPQEDLLRKDLKLILKTVRITD